MNDQRLRNLLIYHEGLKQKPYRDTVNKLTIGVGRNLEDVGISIDEAMILLDNDIQRCREQAVQSFPWFKDLDQVRQDVVLSMIFNLGIGGFSNFKKTINMISLKNFSEASEEMLKSHWARQVGNRALILSRMMRTGKYDSEK